tara:strand:+ start:841 stop:1086 length:246 start_codon:yes stop_codon:yes gene_type:complete
MISKLFWTSSYAITGSMAYLLIKSCYKDLLTEYGMLSEHPTRRHDIYFINPGFIVGFCVGTIQFYAKKPLLEYFSHYKALS